MNDRVTIPCPACGRPMVERENRANGSIFLGCEGFATGFCSHTQPLPEYLRLKQAGATELPGMEDV